VFERTRLKELHSQRVMVLLEMVIKSTQVLIPVLDALLLELGTNSQILLLLKVDVADCLFVFNVHECVPLKLEVHLFLFSLQVKCIVGSPLV
jgi:hypothetical protein